MIKRKLLLSVVSIFSLLLLTDGASASGYNGGFVDAWENSWIVAFGSVTFIGSKEDRISGSEGKYRLQIDKCYKGTSGNRTIIFYDLHYGTSAGLYMTSGSDYLVFLQDSVERNRWMVGLSADKDTISSLWAIKATVDTRSEIESAVGLYQNYQNISESDERKSYLLKQLEKPNRYVSHYFIREIIVNKVVEAIPHFEKQLMSKSESERLSAASLLKCFDHEGVRSYLIMWLNDTQWKDKGSVISESINWKMEEAIPAIRKFVYSDDDLLAVRARQALLQFGEPDAKQLLFDTIKTSSNKIARYNAIHVLHWNYAGGFTTDEIEMIKSLAEDHDESISRVAGFILEKYKQKQEKQIPGT